MSPIKPNSVTHDVLKLAKMLHKPIDEAVVKTVYGYMDSRNAKIKRSFEVLCRLGYADVVGPNTIQITRLGIEQVYKMANPSKRVFDD